ncbi:polyphosphate kinase 2 [Bosea sp. (in: a-proteobacteria)]|uniref:polyphosphate kinase 2 n=1 Tax=Bosea sp. (in: a-proteobacteria) TaxID=1871050 RepID=UPI002FC649C1
MAKGVPSTGRKRTKQDKPSQAAAPDFDFDIEAASLPRAIDEAAFVSGDFPYSRKYKRKAYEKELEPLQIELLKLLRWVRDKGERLIIVFEGRDGAGKGGAIARFTQHLNPRQARVVALSKPSDTEKGQWYFQRYAAQMPAAGEIVFFDRSWYNRAGVEPVMGFCSSEQSAVFLREAPAFEGMLARDGIRVVKLFLTIGREMQMSRLHARWHDPLKRWKLSPIDFEAIPRFDSYSLAFERMLERTSTEWAPWTVIRANDKFRARLNAIRHVLLAVPYEDRDRKAIGEIDDRIVLAADTYLGNGGES